MNDKSANEWLEWLKTVGANDTPPPGMSMRGMISRVLTETVAHTAAVKEWWIESNAIGSARVIVNAPAAFVLAFQQWVDWHKPADEAWEVEQAPSFAQMLRKDPHAQAMIASRSAPTVTAQMRLTQDEAGNIPETRFETLTVLRDGVQIGALSIQVHKGESVRSVTARANVMADNYAQAMVAQGKATAVASAPQWNTGMGFRFDASSSPDAFRKEYQGQWVAQGGTFRFAGRDYPYKSTSDENGARTFVSEMENERVDQLYAGPKVGMLVMDERTSVGVVEMLTATRAVMFTRRNVDSVTLTFGLPKPAEKPLMFPERGVTFDESGDTFVVQSTEKEQSDGCGYHAIGPIHQMFADEIAKKLQPLYENIERLSREYCARPRKAEPDPALVAKLSAEMSAAILGPTHELDRVVERESANVPVKCDPVRWGNVVRVIAASYTERHRTDKPGSSQSDGQWNTAAARELTGTLVLVRPFLASYEAFRRDGYSKPHSCERAAKGEQTHQQRLAWQAYESAK